LADISNRILEHSKARVKRPGHTLIEGAMDDDAHYRKKAADARQMAERSTSPLDRAAWLRMALSWLRLVKHPTDRERSEIDDPKRD
jgi:hypothetical protein